MAWESNTSAVRRPAAIPASSSRRAPWSSAVPAVMHSSGDSLLAFVTQLLGTEVCGQRIDDRIQSAIHDDVELVQRQADAVVRDAILREIVGPDLLAAIARADHGAPFGS